MTTKIESITSKLRNAISADDIDCERCLTCYAGSPNWIVNLQVILEEEGVDVERFCSFYKGYFVYEKGRLFVDGTQCVDLKKIISILRDFLKG